MKDETTQLATQSVTTEPNTTHYAWAGSTLKRLMQATQPVAESWPFFSGPSRPARIARPAAGLTMEELVTRMPEVLGPNGADPDNHNQKYFFVKFLDPSDFPAFAYVGFNPKPVGALNRSPQAFKASFADLLWQERHAVEALAALVRPQVTTAAQFQALKSAYKQWSIEQAQANWQGRARAEMDRFVPAGQADAAQELLTRQQEIRRRITGLMHRIDFEKDQAILIETPTLHAIAGLSLQIHPKVPGNFHPKDELWIYKEIALPDGGRGWLLVEPQRTFDKTESGADFFTPFAWTGDASRGELGFRKPISRKELNTFVELMDATPHPKTHYIRRAERMATPEGATTGQASWYRVVDEPGWPYFLVRELRFDGAGEATAPLSHHSFIELHATRGRVEVELAKGGATDCRVTVTPTQPVFLPASLPHDTITYRATEPACLHHFTR